MAKKYDRIQLVVPKGRQDDIEAYAKEHGESVNAAESSHVFSKAWGIIFYTVGQEKLKAANTIFPSITIN